MISNMEKELLVTEMEELPGCNGSKVQLSPGKNRKHNHQLEGE